MDISIMTINDYEDVYELWIRTPGMGLNGLDDSREGIKKYLDRNPWTCFVAKQKGKVVGVILSGHDGRRGYIYHMAVDITERGKGIGKTLLERALEALRKEGIHKAALVVFEKNALGNVFWEAVGFEKREDLIYRNKVITAEEMKRIDT